MFEKRSSSITFSFDKKQAKKLLPGCAVLYNINMKERLLFIQKDMSVIKFILVLRYVLYYIF